MSMMSIVNIQKSLKSMIMMARLVRPIAMVEVELATSTTKQMTVTETYSNKSVSNQVLRKLVKHHNLVNVNQYLVIPTIMAPFWCQLVLIILISRLRDLKHQYLAGAFFLASVQDNSSV